MAGDKEQVQVPEKVVTIQRSMSGEGMDVTIDGNTKPRTAAVIPAYNEEVTIGSLVLGARQYVDDVIVVDDCSKDHTSLLAESAGARIIRMPVNGGKAKALLTGLREAERQGYDAVVMLDGDGQHRAEDIPAVLGPVLRGESDLNIGSRFLGEQTDIPRYRVFGQKVINRISNASANVDITDSQSGMRAMSFRALKNLDFHSEGYNVESDMITHFAEKGMKISESPISVRYDVPNGHKEGALSMGMKLLSNVVSMIGYKHPLIMFGVPGVVFILVGLAIGVMTLFNFYIMGSFISQAMLAIVFVMVGAFLGVSALTLNSLTLLMKSQFLKGGERL